MATSVVRCTQSPNSELTTRSDQDCTAHFLPEPDRTAAASATQCWWAKLLAHQQVRLGVEHPCLTH